MMRGTKYIWQQEGWPHMQWDDTSFSNILAEINLLRGKLLGRVSMFGFEEQNLSMLESMTQEIVHSAKIEGEELNRADFPSDRLWVPEGAGLHLRSPLPWGFCFHTRLAPCSRINITLKNDKWSSRRGAVVNESD